MRNVLDIWLCKRKHLYYLEIKGKGISLENNFVETLFSQPIISVRPQFAIMLSFYREWWETSFPPARIFNHLKYSLISNQSNWGFSEKGITVQEHMASPPSTRSSAHLGCSQSGPANRRHKKIPCKSPDCKTGWRKYRKSHLFLLWIGKNLSLEVPGCPDARWAALVLGTVWLWGNRRALVRPELLNLFLGWTWYLPASKTTQQAGEVVGSPLARQGMITHTAEMSTYIFTCSTQDDWSGLKCYFWKEKYCQNDFGLLLPLILWGERWEVFVIEPCQSIIEWFHAFKEIIPTRCSPFYQNNHSPALGIYICDKMQYCSGAVMETSAAQSREQDPWLTVGAYTCTNGQEWILHVHGVLRAPDSAWEQSLRYKQRKEREWGWTNDLITGHYRLATNTHFPSRVKEISMAPQDNSGKPCLWIL